MTDAASIDAILTGEAFAGAGGNGEPWRVMTDVLDRRIARALFVSLWALYALIGPGLTVINSNTVSRMGFVFSVIQHHTLDIDAFARLTDDKALFAGHYYLDKAPGLSLMALPLVAAAEGAARLSGIATAPIVDGQLSPFFFVMIWLAVAVTTALLTAAAAGVLYLFARRSGAARGAALFGALGFALCTPAFGWATVFFSHAAADACLFIGFALMVIASDPAAQSRRSAGIACIAGAVLSWSVVLEFTAAAGVLVIAGVGCWRLRALPSAQCARLLTAAIAGGALAALPLAICNYLAFGSIAHLAYSNEVGFLGMQTGLFGVGLPRADVLTELLVGTRRGILWLAPLLAVVPLAWAASFRRLGAPLGITLLAIPACYLLIDSGYVYWDGGWSTGPRHITPALPFVSFALVTLWEAAGRRSRAGLLAIAGASFVVSLMCATTTMTCPQWFGGILVDNELRDVVLPLFMAGDVHHWLAPIGHGGLGSLAYLPMPGLIQVVASGLLPLFRRRTPSEEREIVAPPQPQGMPIFRSFAWAKSCATASTPLRQATRSARRA
jgi:hypothetical protein